MKKNLEQLYQEHQGKVSDKWSLYLSEFNRLFDPYRDLPVRLLEIGIQNGGSLEIWSHFFSKLEKLVGCDIDPACANLDYEDPRISVIVSDANLDDTQRQINAISSSFNIVIDDGSHFSSDIVKSFARYFACLEDNGIFVAEDLHCSYWQEFEGGLFDPYSSISFFKLLADAISFEHWGVSKTRVDLLAGFSEKYGVTFTEELLASIHSVEFVNSLCVVRKAPAQQNQLGVRVTTGDQELVVPGIRRLAQTSGLALAQPANFWSLRERPPAEDFQQLLDLAAGRLEKLNELEASVIEKDAELNRVLAQNETVVREKDLELKRTQALNETVVREKEADLMRMQTLNEELSQKIQSLTKDITSVKATLAGSSLLLEEQNRRLGEHETEARTLHATIRSRENDIVLARDEVRALRNSTSWKVSAPLRVVGAQVRRFDRVTKTIPKAIKQSGGVVASYRKASAIVKSEGLIGVRHRLYLLRLRETNPEADGQPGVSQHTDVYSTWVNEHDSLTPVRIAEIHEKIRSLRSMPVISVLMPVYNPPLEFLDAAIQSVRNQLYSKWELCIADDASTDPAVAELLKKHAASDPRIRLMFRKTNGHISESSNSALALATGEFVALLDQDDCLHLEALSELALQIDQDSCVDILYTDEDKLGLDGNRCMPFFKPDWSPHLAISQAFLGHLACYRTTLLRSLGGFRSKCDGAQDYDLWLRASLQARRIVHIPKVLYHWRMHLASTSMNSSSKSYANEAGRSAVHDYLQKRYDGLGVSAVDNEHFFTYKASFSLPPDLLISIIIPTRDGLGLLKPCIDSILHRSSWTHFEILILDNGSKEPETLAYLKTVPVADSRVRVISADMPFNWSKLNNLGVKFAKGEVFVFLNNDTVVITPDWLQSLAGYARLPDVGTVGALLLFEDGTIQHSGVVVGMGGWADHVFRMQPPVHTGGGPFVSPTLTRNVLAVTGACTAITREKFDRLGRYDEAFIICGSDVELGLRAHKAGLYNVLCAEAKLFHFESKTRTPHVPDEDFRQSILKYAPYRVDKTDPFYNPNLSLTGTAPELNLPASHA